MKKIFKRGMSGLLAVLMAFTMLAGFGTTTAFAASETAESYMISFPRDGDAAQIYSEDAWGHSAKSYMNGWATGSSNYTTNTYGRSRGRNGSYSTNYQLAGRELMTPDEVRMLDNQYALLFIRGERPIRDLKYDILHHPNVALTTDGSAPAYTHGEDTRSIASMAFSFDKKAVKNAEKLEAEKHEFLLYSEEELEELLDEKEKKDNEET